MNGSRKAVEVVIVGGGFGGIYTALNLEKLWRNEAGLNITLISHNNYFLMTPLLFEAGSGILEPRHAVNPIRPLLKKTRFVEADATSIDIAQRRVCARHSAGNVLYEIPYDHLVLALGGVTNRSIIPGSEYAAAFKVLADAIYLRNHVIDLFERADVEPDAELRRALLRFVVIGGGLVGIELMGELTEFVWNLQRNYPRVSRKDVEFHLLDAGPRILSEMEQSLAAYTEKHFSERGVVIKTGTPVERIEPNQVHLPDGTVLAAHTIVLAAGVGPHPLLHDLPLEKGKGGRLVVDATMRSGQHPEVWAIGDCALIPDPAGNPYPQLAQHALRQARVLARNIDAAVRGGAARPFVYQTLGTLASLGHFRGVGRIGRINIYGFLAWWVWRTYYVMQMPRLDRRLRIIMDWTIALFFRNDIVKLDLFGAPYPPQVPAGQPHEIIVTPPGAIKERVPNGIDS